MLLKMPMIAGGKQPSELMSVRMMPRVNWKTNQVDYLTAVLTHLPTINYQTSGYLTTEFASASTCSLIRNYWFQWIKNSLIMRCWNCISERPLIKNLIRDRIYLPMMVVAGKFFFLLRWKGGVEQRKFWLIFNHVLLPSTKRGLHFSNFTCTLLEFSVIGEFAPPLHTSLSIAPQKRVPIGSL